MQVAPCPGLCWPHDSQACLAHITTMILNCGRVASDMRSPRVFFDAVASGHWPFRRLSPRMHEYPRCFILMR